MVPSVDLSRFCCKLKSTRNLRHFASTPGLSWSSNQLAKYGYFPDRPFYRSGRDCHAREGSQGDDYGASAGTLASDHAADYRTATVGATGLDHLTRLSGVEE